MAYTGSATTKGGRNGRVVLDKAEVQALVEAAHKICPYSRATRSNVPVTLTVA
jgi:organic hydroperoxide reductase OsmC/OhrA